MTIRRGRSLEDRPLRQIAPPSREQHRGTGESRRVLRQLAGLHRPEFSIGRSHVPVDRRHEPI